MADIRERESAPRRALTDRLKAGDQPETGQMVPDWPAFGGSPVFRRRVSGCGGLPRAEPAPRPSADQCIEQWQRGG